MAFGLCRPVLVWVLTPTSSKMRIQSVSALMLAMLMAMVAAAPDRREGMEGRK